MSYLLVNNTRDSDFSGENRGKFFNFSNVFGHEYLSQRSVMKWQIARETE